MSNAKPEVEAVEVLTAAIREEQVRQYRKSEKKRCPAGPVFFEEEVAPYLIAQAAITAYHAHLAEAGFAIVPVEPTEGRVRTALKAIEREDDVLYHMCDLLAFYRAMIAAHESGE